jgi:uncharacterized protein (DUF1501 family)
LQGVPGMERERLDAVERLNNDLLQRNQVDPALEGVINSFELGFRMQMSAPDLLDFSKESPETLAMYGVNEEPTKQFATNCLLARRMVERGVRFVMLNHASWDDHTDLNRKLKTHCDTADKPTAALIKDLKQRGLLDDTLVIWGGEFGRTPMGEPRGNIGRDHHIDAYTMWRAGGGVKRGFVHGQTDEIGYEVVEGRVHVHDLQATVLQQMGLEMDHFGSSTSVLTTPDESRAASGVERSACSALSPRGAFTAKSMVCCI